MLDNLGAVADHVVETGAAPVCNVCDRTALPFPCLRCGEFACHLHVWVHSDGSGADCLCAACVDELAAMDKRRGGGRKPKPKRAKRPPPPPPEPKWEEVWEDEPEDDGRQENEGWPWTTLGLQPGATLQEIKKAYRNKAQTCHPDKPWGSAEAFKELTRAYEEAQRLASH